MEENRGRKIRELLGLLQKSPNAPSIAPGEPVPEEEEIKKRILNNKKRMRKSADEAAKLSGMPRPIGRDLP